MRDKMVSSGEGFREETPQNFTLKFVKDMTIDVMESNIIIEMFQAMAIVSFKMGNLGLEVQSLKTKLTIVKGEKHRLLQQI
jgi:hypothetical protein